jgi:hypothetical protein
MLPRSFHRYKNTLSEEFGVEICCRDGDYAYFIKNPEILGDHRIPQWLLKTLSVSERLRECISLKNRIRLEYVPSGGRKLEVVISAMQKDRKMNYKYQRYGSAERKSMEAGVCGLVLYNQRWYILGEFDDRKRYTFALDRIWDPEVSDAVFVADTTFDVNQYFSEFYGIYNSGRETTNIVLRAFDDEPYYMRDLPIHPSQKEIGIGDGYADFAAADTTGDGNYDTYAYDSNGDGYVDFVGQDTDGDGNIDVGVADTNHDGYADTYAADTTGDGNPDTYGFDYDEDGEIDEYGIDEDGDGDIDYYTDDIDDDVFDDF